VKKAPVKKVQEAPKNDPAQPKKKNRKRVAERFAAQEAEKTNQENNQ